MTISEIFRILSPEQNIRIVQYEYDGIEEFKMEVLPFNIPIYLMDVSIQEISHSKDVLVITLCN